LIERSEELGGLFLLGKITIVSVVVGILYMDRVAVFQGMLHRPIVVSLVGGLILGALRESMMAGLLLEILWIARLPVGATVPPDDTTAALFAVCAITALSSFRTITMADVGFVVSVSVVVGEVAKEADIFVRKINARIARYARTAVELGDFRTFESSVFASLMVWLVAGVSVSLLTGFVGTAVGRTVGEFLPLEMIKLFRIMYFIIPAVGVVSLYQHCRVGNRGAVFHTALASGALVFVLFELGVI